MRSNIRILKYLKNLNKELSGIGKLLKKTDKKKSDNKVLNNRLSVAIFHIAILALIAVAISSYFIFYSQKIQNMVDKAIRNAEEINQINFVRSLYYPDPLDYQKYIKFSEDVVFYYAIEIQTYLFAIKMGGKTHPGHFPVKDSFLVPNDPAERAEKAFKLLNMVLHRYPFNEGIYELTETSVSTGPPKPMIFKDFQVLNTWFRDFEKTCSSLSTIFLLGNDRSLEHIKYIEALADREKEEIQKYEKFGNSFGYSSNPADPVYIFNDFLVKFNKVLNVVEATKIQMVRVEQYKMKMKVTNIIIMFFMILSFIAFLLGATVPLFLSFDNEIIQIKIPVVIYTFFLAYVFWKTFISIQSY